MAVHTMEELAKILIKALESEAELKRIIADLTQSPGTSKYYSKVESYQQDLEDIQTVLNLIKQLILKKET